MSDDARKLARALVDAMMGGGEQTMREVADATTAMIAASLEHGAHDYCSRCVYRGHRDRCVECWSSPPSRFEGLQ